MRRSIGITGPPGAGKSMIAAAFDRELEVPVPDAIKIPQELSVVVVGGNYPLLESGGWEQIVPLSDATSFRYLDEGIRLQRLVDHHKRLGESGADARARTLGPDERNARLVASTRSRADHIIRIA